MVRVCGYCGKERARRINPRFTMRSPPSAGTRTRWPPRIWEAKETRTTRSLPPPSHARRAKVSCSHALTKTALLDLRIAGQRRQGARFESQPAERTQGRSAVGPGSPRLHFARSSSRLPLVDRFSSWKQSLRQSLRMGQPSANLRIKREISYTHIELKVPSTDMGPQTRSKVLSSLSYHL